MNHRRRGFERENETRRDRNQIRPNQRPCGRSSATHCHTSTFPHWLAVRNIGASLGLMRFGDVSTNCWFLPKASLKAVPRGSMKEFRLMNLLQQQHSFLNLMKRSLDWGNELMASLWFQSLEDISWRLTKEACVPEVISPMNHRWRNSHRSGDQKQSISLRHIGYFYTYC